MKKNFRLILLLILSLILAVSLCACNPNTGNSGDGGNGGNGGNGGGANGGGNSNPDDGFYQAYNVTDVYMSQVSTNVYLYKVKTDFECSDNAKVYISRYEKLPATAEPIEYTKEDGALVLTAKVPYERYFIRVIDGDKNAVMPMAKPMCAPALAKTNGTNIVTFNFVEGTSWSSFCDPTGKAVYRSANNKFDDSAELLAKNLQIVSAESFTDTTPDASKPYYYVVITSKNGAVTYVSAPIVDYATAFKDVAVTIENVNNRATLAITGTFNIAGDVAVDIYSKDTRLGNVTELIGELVSGNAGDKFRATLDFTSIIKASGAGVWYDIKLTTSGGLRFDIPSSAGDLTKATEVESATIEFKQYAGLLKLNYSFYDAVVSSVTIDDSDATRGPILIVTGAVANDVTNIKLHADATIGGYKHEYFWENVSKNSGEFRFEVELSDLPTEETPWCWFHLYLYKNNSSVESSKMDLNRGPALSIGQEFVHGSTKYIIQAYENEGAQLVIQANPNK